VLPIRLLLVDDQQFFRRGLRQVCEAEPDMVIVGEAGDGEIAVTLVPQLHPDVILMDIRMPVIDGVEATRLITAANPAARIIILTMFGQDEFVLEAIKAGAWGYLLKDTAEDTLLQAIRTVARGEALLDARVTTKLLLEFRRLADSTTLPAPPPLETLAEIEVAILRLVALGEENVVIAQHLHLAEKTVANRLSTIYQKLHVTNRVQAALYALRYGLADLAPRFPQ